jgi:hypothetical protein
VNEPLQTKKVCNIGPWRKTRLSLFLFTCRALLSAFSVGLSVLLVGDGFIEHDVVEHLVDINKLFILFFVAVQIPGKSGYSQIYQEMAPRHAA